MRGLILISALMMAGCISERSDAAPKEFQTFNASANQGYYCTFYKEGYDPTGVAMEDQELVFVTLIGDAPANARVRFGDETLRLLPKPSPSLKETPVATFANEPVTLTYTVQEYSSFEVVLDLEPTGTGPENVNYEGRLEMIGLDASVDIFGSCGV